MTAEPTRPSPKMLAGRRAPDLAGAAARQQPTEEDTAQAPEAVIDAAWFKQPASSEAVTRAQMQLEAAATALRAFEDGRLYQIMLDNPEFRRWLLRPLPQRPTRGRVRAAIQIVGHFQRFLARPDLVDAAIAAVGNDEALAALDGRRGEAAARLRSIPDDLRPPRAWSRLENCPRPDQVWPQLFAVMWAIAQVLEGQEVGTV